MHTVQVALENPSFLRLTLFVQVPIRNIPYENEACQTAETRANDPTGEHAKHGPWTTTHSGFIN